MPVIDPVNAEPAAPTAEDWADAVAAYRNWLACKPAAEVWRRAQAGVPSTPSNGWSIVYRDHAWWIRHDGFGEQFAFPHDAVAAQRVKLKAVQW